jgi:glyoxylase-like metal-dependent hydrolase (beta-lactamase superfamily II)
MKISDHFDGQKFHNLRDVAARPFSEVPRMMAERGTPWPAVPVVPQQPGALGEATAIITFIGHATFLIQTPAGNVLWDCVALLDDATVEKINALGGLAAIAISHPHFHTTIVEWSRAFDAPVHIHRDNQPWVMRPDETAIAYWQGEAFEPLLGTTLIHCGGHFPGGTVLHWAGGAQGKGALLTGDVIQVGLDRKTVSFMYSYPNYIPLSPRTVRQIVEAVEPFEFDQIYGAWFGRNILKDAKQVLRYSADRYLSAISDDRSS